MKTKQGPHSEKQKRTWLSVFQWILLLSLFTVATQASSPETIPPAAFAQLPQIHAPVLSPDGKAIAFVRYEQDRAWLAVQEIGEPSSVRRLGSDDGSRIRWLRWIDDERLLLVTDVVYRRRHPHAAGMREPLMTAASMLLIDRESSSQRRLVWRSDLAPWALYRVPALVSALADEAGYILVSRLKHFDDVEVYRVSLETGKARLAVPYSSGIHYWLADQTGYVRFGSGGAPGSRTVFRSSGSKFVRGENYPWLADGWVPVAFDINPTIAVVAGHGDGGTRELKRLNTKSGAFLDTLFSDPDHSFEDVIVDRQGRLVGVRFTDDHERLHYLDTELAEVSKTADETLPDTVNQIVSFSDNRRVLIVRAASDTDPGFFNLWDRDAGTFESIGVAMPALPPEQMSPTRRVSFPAADGLTIPAYLTLPAGSDGTGLPAVVLQHEGLGARADAGFDFLVQFLASRGYAVLQPNVRGTPGYTRQYGQAGVGEWGRAMQDDLAAAARWLTDEGIADRGRVCVAGRLYGGYAAAMAAIKTPESFRCAVSINGLLDLLGFSLKLRSEAAARYDLHNEFGLPVTGLGRVSPMSHLESVRIPIMILHVRDSALVPYLFATRMARRLKKLDKSVQLVDLGSGGLDVANVESRLLMLQSIESFLAEHTGERSAP